MWQILLQNARANLLQNAIKVSYKMRQVSYYKMRQLLQIASILLQNAKFIANVSFHNVSLKYIGDSKTLQN